MRRLLLAACLFLLYAGAIAQVKDSVRVKLFTGDEILIKQMDPDPLNFRNFYAGVGLSIDHDPINGNRVMVVIRNQIFFHPRAAFRMRLDFNPISDFDEQRSYFKDNFRVRTTNNFKPFLTVELGLGGYFYDKTISRTRSLLVKVQKVGLKQARIMTFVEYPIRRLIGIRVGYQYYQTIVNNKYLDADSLIDDTGQRVADGGPFPIGGLTILDEVYHTNLTAHNLYFGLDLKTIKNVILRFEDSEVERSESWNLYADVLIAPVLKVQEMVVQDTSGAISTHVVAHDGGGGYHLNRVGFRMGFDYMKFFKNNHGWGFNVEAGLRPGFTNAYNPTGGWVARLMFNLSASYRFGLKL